MLLIFVKWFFKPSNYFSRFILSCCFLDSEFYFLSYTYFEYREVLYILWNYVQKNTYTVTYCAVDYRILVHILNDRWRFTWMCTYTDNYWMLRWYFTIHLIHLLILYSGIVLNEKNFEGQNIKRKKLICLYEKIVYEIYVEIAIGAVAMVSHYIWKSKLYIYADGQ